MTMPDKRNPLFFIANETAMHAFAARIADACADGVGAVIFLQGELGAGKTTFVRGFLQALGYRGHVKSPTYTLLEPYEIEIGAVYHFDLYRIADPAELEYMGLRDYFAPGNIILLEWPSCGAGMLPTADITVQIDFTDSGRLVAVSAQTVRGEDMLQKM